MMWKYWYLFLLWIAYFDSMYAQNDIFPLTHYNIDDGLSHEYISSIVKDQEGFIWFGTRNGLNRFDGLHFETINPFPESGLYTAIHHFDQDEDGWFWLVTNDGLVRFHPKTRESKQVILPDDWSANTLYTQLYRIHLTKKGYAWFATQKHLYKINLKTQQYQQFKMPFLASRLFFRPFEDSKGRVWVQISTALYRFEEKTTQFKYYYGIDDLHTDLNQNFTNILYEDSAGQLWLPIWYDYPRVYDEVSDTFVARGKTKNIINAFQEDIAENGKRFLWAAGGATGLQLIWLDDFSITHIETNPCKSFTHNGSAVICFLKDVEANIVWIGTDLGIEKYDHHATRFKRTPLFNEGRMKLLGDISKIIQDNQQSKIYWLAVWNNGLFRWDRKTNTLEHFNQKRTPMQDPALFDMVQEKNGSLWLAAAGGFYQFNPKTSEWKIFKDFFKRTKSVNNVITIFKDEKNDRIWIGCNHEGVWFLENGESEPTRWKFPDISLEERHYITKIQQDAQGNLWVASHSGLHKINFEKKTSEKISLGLYGKDKTAVNSFLITTYQHIWVSGVDFLMELDKNGKFIQNFNTQRSFGSHPFHLAEDELGNIWIGSDNGLHLLNPQTKKFRTFHKDEGLIRNHIANRFTICRNGELFIGFDGGEFNYFHPRFFRYNLKKPQISFTEIRINNRPRIINPEQALLLKPHENALHFQFSALNYSLSHKNKFAYKLEGFDTKWNYSREPQANYTNLDAGTYTFRVIASNNDNIWNEQGIALKIIVLAPFYQRWWFRLFIFFILIGTLYALIAYRQSQRKRIDAIRNRIAKDLHDDMGSTLSSIRIISEVLQNQIAQAHPQSANMLHRISQGAASLSDAMQDIIWSIKTDFDTLEDMLARMRAFALKLLESKEIMFKTNISDNFENTHLNIEQRRNIYLIFKEAINNAVKYADCKTIELSILLDKNDFRMVIQDNGKGFDFQTISLGNGLQNMQKRAEELKGQCHIISQLGKGTRVELFLKL